MLELAMPTDQSSSSGKDRLEQCLEESCCATYCLRPNPMTARFVYAFIFLITNLSAWAIRDYGHPVLSELQRLKGCQGARYCLGAEGVLRVSFGCFSFFFLMFLTTINTRKVSDCRNSWHSEWWPVKIILWLGFMVISFLIPSPFIQIYGKVAHFGAGAFLIIQLISVISFISWLNDCCHSEKNLKRCHVQVLVLSLASYVVSIVGIILMYVLYAPNPSCGRNILFITITLILLQFMACISMHSKIKAGHLAPGLMGLYVVFLCWSAIRSEPHTESCNRKAQVASNSDWITIASFVIAVLVIVMATFSTGIDSKCFQFKKTEAESEDDIPYGFGFFHSVFGMGAMYFAMLFVGWNAQQTMPKWTIDVGWASAWVRIVNQWLAALFYVWMLIAPMIWKRKKVDSREGSA